MSRATSVTPEQQAVSTLLKAILVPGGARTMSEDEVNASPLEHFITGVLTESRGAIKPPRTGSTDPGVISRLNDSVDSFVFTSAGTAGALAEVIAGSENPEADVFFAAIQEAVKRYPERAPELYALVSPNPLFAAFAVNQVADVAASISDDQRQFLAVIASQVPAGSGAGFLEKELLKKKFDPVFQLHAKLAEQQLLLSASPSPENAVNFLAAAAEFRASARAASQPTTNDAGALVASPIEAEWNRIQGLTRLPGYPALSTAAYNFVGVGTPPYVPSATTLSPGPIPGHAVPLTIAACLNDAKTLAASIANSYQKDFVAPGNPQERIQRLIDANELRIAGIQKLQREANAEFQAHLTALEAGTAVDPKHVQNIMQLNEQVKRLVGEIAGSRQNYRNLEGPLKRTIATQAREKTAADKVQAKQDKKQLKADKVEAVKALAASLRPEGAIAAHLESREDSQENQHPLERARRSGFGNTYDIFFKPTSRVAQKWVDEYDKAATTREKVGMVVERIGGMLTAPFIMIAQAYSYGFNKIFSSWASVDADGKRSAAKIVPRSLWLAALVAVAIAISFIPGVNAAAAAVAISFLVIAPLALSAAVYATRGWEDYFARSATTDVKVKLNSAELGLPGSKLVEITLGKEELAELLKTVVSMKRAYLDETRALSTEERNRFKGYEENILKGDLVVINTVLDSINLANGKKSGEEGYLSIASFESAESKRDRARAAAPAVASPQSAALAGAALAPAAAGISPQSTLLSSPLAGAALTHAAPPPATYIPRPPAYAATGSIAHGGGAYTSLPDVGDDIAAWTAPPPPPPSPAGYAAASSGTRRGMTSPTSAVYASGSDAVASSFSTGSSSAGRSPTMASPPPGGWRSSAAAHSSASASAAAGARFNPDSLVSRTDEYFTRGVYATRGPGLGSGSGV